MSNVYVRDTTLTFKKGSWDIDEHSKVFRKMLDFLGQHGFYVCKDKEIVKNFPSLSKYRYEGGFGELRFKAEYHENRCKIEFYQNVNVVNQNGGFYDFDKLEKMPYLIKLRFEWIKKHLIDFFTQYFNQSVKIKYYDEPTLAVDKIKERWVNSCHHRIKDMNFNLSDFDGKEQLEYPSYGHIGADGKKLCNGDIKYFYDRSGHLCRGKIYEDINDNWDVIINKYEIKCNYHSSIFFSECTKYTPRRKADISNAGRRWQQKMRYLHENYSNKEIEHEYKRRLEDKVK